MLVARLTWSDVEMLAADTVNMTFDAAIVGEFCIEAMRDSFSPYKDELIAGSGSGMDDFWMQVAKDNAVYREMIVKAVDNALEQGSYVEPHHTA